MVRIFLFRRNRVECTFCANTSYPVALAASCGIHRLHQDSQESFKEENQAVFTAAWLERSRFMFFRVFETFWLFFLIRAPGAHIRAARSNTCTPAARSSGTPYPTVAKSSPTFPTASPPRSARTMCSRTRKCCREFGAWWGSCSDEPEPMWFRFSACCW